MASNSTSPPTKAEIEGILGLAFATEVFAPASYWDISMIAVIDKMVEENYTVSVAPLLPPGEHAYETLQSIQAVLHTLPLERNGTPYAIGYVVMGVIASIFVAARIYSRKRYTNAIRAEDWTAVAAMLFIAGLTAAAVAENFIYKGYSGIHIWEVSVNEVRSVLKLIVPNEVHFSLCHLLVKCTFLAFYYTLTPSRAYRRWILAVGAYMVAVTLISIISIPLQCRPVDIWNHILTAKCINRVAASIVMSVFYVLADVFILVLPIPAVLKLRLQKRDKITVLSMFCAGVVVCIFAGIRINAMRIWIATVDMTWELNHHRLWVFLELDMSMIISSLPAIYKALIGRHREMTQALPVMTSGNYGGKRRRMSMRDTNIIAAAATVASIDSKAGCGPNEIKEKDNMEPIAGERGVEEV